MKIGIISINAHTKVLNFASPLHSYAFQQFLKQEGIDSVIVDYKPCYYGNSNPRMPLIQYLKHPIKNKKEQIKKLIHHGILFFPTIKRFDKIQEFIDTYYIKTEKCYTEELLDKEAIPGVDCFCCVTDVIWKQNPNKGFDRGFFLACKSMKDFSKISYAASRGATTYDEEHEKEFLSYIKELDAVSVRERSLKEYIETISDIKPRLVADPVFLHEKEFYLKHMKKPKNKRGYVLLYIVMNRADSLVKAAAEYAKARDLDLIELSEYYIDKKVSGYSRHKVIYGIGIEEWLGYIEGAEYIFTQSFHACCFSIIFEKPFSAGKRGGDKVDLLLETFELTNRKTAKAEEDSKQEEVIDINWENVRNIKQKMVSESKEFLLEAINNAKNRTVTESEKEDMVSTKN